MRQRAAWREFLDTILRNSSEREQIISKTGINSMTLARWAHGESKPRAHNLRLLINALPAQYQDQFQQLLEEDLPPIVAASPTEEEVLFDEIPYPFIREVLATRTNCPPSLLLWTITNQVFQHALGQLDPQSQGMAITLVRCMPPTRDGKIHSLCESMRRGTSPWLEHLEQTALFLGANTLSGYAINTLRYEQVPDMRKRSGYVPAVQGEYEVSAAAYPIMFTGCVAGCLLFSSTQANRFSSEKRSSLIQSYTNLVALAFEPKDFYPPNIIELTVMPSPERQKAYFADFRYRVVTLMKESAGTPYALNSLQAQLAALQQLEELMLQQLSSEQPT